MKRVKQGKRSAPRPQVKHKTPNPQTLKKLALAIVITVFAAILYTSIAGHTQEAHQRVELQKTVNQLQKTKKDLLQEKSTSQQQQDAKDKQIQELNQQLQDKEKQLQAKRAAAIAYAAQAPVRAAAPYVSTTVSGCGDNTYANYIYMHESGCNTSAVNSIGCRGIGQACPSEKLPCGADYACQNAFFTTYALTRYGSWAGAYQFWVSNNWW